VSVSVSTDSIASFTLFFRGIRSVQVWSRVRVPLSADPGRSGQWSAQAENFAGPAVHYRQNTGKGKRSSFVALAGPLHTRESKPAPLFDHEHR
jgi:hypothetical protein